MNEIYEYKVKTIKGESISISEYKDKILLIVNTASRCGFTPQYKGLQNLYEKYKEQGLEILGFPCNQFANQEPGTNLEIENFCELNFGVTFPLFEKVDVKGKNQHPLFEYLTRKAKSSFFSKEIKWNFTKFLIDNQGKIIKRFAPISPPEKIEPYIIKLVEKKN